MNTPLRIHRHPLSGHSHRVELFAALTGLEYELIDIDLLAGAHKQPDFLSLNPAGQVPVLEDGDTIITDSNGILVYLARRYAPDWLPTDPVAEAEVQRVFSWAAGDQAFGPAAARLVTVFGAPLNAEYHKAVAKRYLDRLEAHLEGRDWVVGSRPTIADVALYSYTAHGPEGGVGLEPYSRIRAYLDRIRALPGFVGMQESVVEAA